MIRWTGHNTSGNWKRTVEADNMHDLFSILASEPFKGDVEPLIGGDEYVEKAVNKWTDIAQLGEKLNWATENGTPEEEDKLNDDLFALIDDKIHALTDEELQSYIKSFNGQAYYQEFIDLDALEKLKKSSIDRVKFLFTAFEPDEIIEDINFVDKPVDLNEIVDTLETLGKDLLQLADKIDDEHLYM